MALGEVYIAVGFAFYTDVNAKQYAITSRHRIAFGKLYVHVIEARGVLASDYSLFGDAMSDPYCEVLVGGAVEKERTRTRHITSTLNPVWDEAFVLDVHRPYATLTVKVYDYDRYSKDDHIGRSASLMSSRLHSALLTFRLQARRMYRLSSSEARPCTTCGCNCILRMGWLPTRAEDTSTCESSVFVNHPSAVLVFVTYAPTRRPGCVRTCIA